MGEIDDVEAALEQRLREQLWWWRVERVLALLLLAVVTGIGVLALRDGLPRSWWLLAPAVLALVLVVPGARSQWTRRRWPAPGPDLRRLGYRRMTEVHAAIERGDPVAPEHRGLVLVVRLSALEVRYCVWVILVQAGLQAPQLRAASAERFEVFRIVLAALFMTGIAGGIGLFEREAQRAQRLLDAPWATPDPTSS